MGHPGDSYVLRAGKNKDILLDIPTGQGEFPKVKDTIPKSTLTLLPEHAVVRLLGIECQFLVTS
ncbi:hypothetical protein I310019A7_19830 [Lawsonibacter asaccharolyticus]